MRLRNMFIGNFDSQTVRKGFDRFFFILRLVSGLLLNVFEWFYGSLIISKDAFLKFKCEMPQTLDDAHGKGKIKF